MVAKGIDNMTPQRRGERQPSLFCPNLPSTLDVGGPDVPCDVVAIEKRRDGGTRFWCRAHRADATAKGGTRARKCRAADVVPIRPEEILTLDLDKYLGGVALWGAVPAVYDTTRLDGPWHPRPRPADAGLAEGNGLHLPGRPALRERSAGRRRRGQRDRRDLLHGQLGLPLSDVLRHLHPLRLAAPRQGLVQRSPAPPTSVRRLREALPRSSDRDRQSDHGRPRRPAGSRNTRSRRPRRRWT